MDFESIRYFLRTCELKSMTRAAEELFISQPALSRRIIALEDELGVELLQRTGNGVLITRAGEEFYREEKKMIEAQDDLKSRIGKFRSGRTGTFRVSSDLKVAFSQEIIIATDFLKKSFPNVKLNLNLMDTARLHTSFKNRGSDMIITYRSCLRNVRSTSIATIMENKACAVVPTGHRLAGRKSITRKDLAGERIIMPDLFDTDPNNVFSSAFRSIPPSDCEVNINHSWGDGLYIAAFKGCIALASSLAYSELEDFKGILQLIPFSDVDFSIGDICAQYYADSKYAGIFTDLLVSGIPEKEK